MGAFVKAGLGTIATVFLATCIAMMLGEAMPASGWFIAVGAQVFVIGGVLGLALHENWLAPAAGAQRPAANGHPFASHWSADSDTSVADALAELVERHWRGYGPTLRYVGPGSLEVTFRPHEPMVPLRLVLVADVKADEVVTTFHGPRGEVVMRSGAWRGDAAPNAHLRRLHAFVQELLDEQLAYMVDGHGEHRFVPRYEVAAALESDPAALVRSWHGSLDHSARSRSVRADA